MACLITLLFHCCGAITTDAFFHDILYIDTRKKEIQIDCLVPISVLVNAGSVWINGIEGCWLKEEDGLKNKRNWLEPLGIDLM